MSDSTNLSIDDLAEEAENSAKSESKTIELSAEESEAILREVSGDSKRTLIEQYLLEIYADGKLKQSQGQRFSSSREIQELLKKKIELEHGDNIRVKSALLNCVPSQRTIRRISRKEGWNDEVVKEMKENGLFTPEDRAAVMLAIRNEAIKGDMVAAKLYATMTGDYDEKGQSSDEKFNVYKKYADAMSRKKPETK